MTTFTVLHRAMRLDARRLADAVETLDDGGRRAAALSRWYRGLRTELIAHHSVEDELFFPVLAERVPSFAAHGERIEADHHQLDVTLGDVATALDALAAVDGPLAGTEARARAQASTRELSQLLDRHLGFEDADVLPLYLRHFTPDEYGEINERAMEMASKASLVFTIPWAMEAATADERARMLGEAPLAFRLLWYASRGRYARLSRRALGARPASAADHAGPGEPADPREVA